MSNYQFVKSGEQKYGILIESDAGYISPFDKQNSIILNEMKAPEDKSGVMKTPLKVYAVLQKYGVKNRNGRIYPKNVLIQQNEAYQQAIKEKRALGECNHPESNIISLDRVTHNITKTWWDGSTLMGELEILMSPGYINYGIVSTPGDEIANLLKNGITVGISSRGIGSVKESYGDMVVQDDFEIICWDIVSSPSTPGSWVFNNLESAKPFMESEDKNTQKNTLSENLDRFLINF